MRATIAGVCALLVLAVAIAMFAPATLVDARLTASSDGHLRVAEARGTLWHGDGVLATSDGRWRVPIEWTLDPLAALRGEASIVFSTPPRGAHGVQGGIHLRDSRIWARAFNARVPATLVATLAPDLGLDAGGDVELRSSALSLAPAGSSGQLDATWHNARLSARGLPMVDLGTVSTQLAVRGNALAGPVSNAGGTVRITGNLSLAADRVSADLRLTPDASAAPSLRNALEALGRPDGSGAIAVRVDRNLR